MLLWDHLVASHAGNQSDLVASYHEHFDLLRLDDLDAAHDSDPFLKMRIDGTSIYYSWTTIS